MGDPLAVLLVAGVHAVRVAVAAPAHGDAEPVQPALELVSVAAPGRARGWWEAMPCSLPSPRGTGNQEGLGGRSGASRSAATGAPRGAGGACGHPAGGQKLQGSLLGSRGLCPGLSRHKDSRTGAVGHLSPPPLSPGRAWKGAALPASTKAGTRGRGRPTAKVQPSPVVARGAHPGWCSWRESRHCSPHSRCPRHTSSARGCSARCCT